MSPKHAEQDQIDAKWLGKSFFWREGRRVGRSLIILNKSIKEVGTRENTAFGVHSMK